MNYELSDKNHNEISHGDLQDKMKWCRIGEEFEELFIKTYGQQLSLKINPEKSHDRYVADLINTADHSLADLKTQTTPFFTASRYGFNPQCTVTFNEKDYLRYLEKYPTFVVYFWVSWVSLGYKGESIKVNPLTGVWKISLKDITELVSTKQAYLHTYRNRGDDTKGNAKTSYLFNLGWKEFERLV